jgi:tetratricopeptide (TPR) repeat protein
MSRLLDAIDAEVRGEFGRAIEAYRGLTDEGSDLDRIGIYQALARCHEKTARLEDAAPWRRRAAVGYMGLPDDVMGKDERRYYALVEARNAMQDLSGNLTALAEALPQYKHILEENWKAGPEGLTHEGLFGALLLWRHGDPASALRYFFDVAEAVNEQATEKSDANLRLLSTRLYELAEDAAKKANRPDVANVAAKRSLALRGGPRPQTLGGL